MFLLEQPKNTCIISVLYTAVYRAFFVVSVCATEMFNKLYIFT